MDLFLCGKPPRLVPVSLILSLFSSCVLPLCLGAPAPTAPGELNSPPLLHLFIDTGRPHSKCFTSNPSLQMTRGVQSCRTVDCNALSTSVNHVQPCPDTRSTKSDSSVLFFAVIFRLKTNQIRINLKYLDEYTHIEPKFYEYVQKHFPGSKLEASGYIYPI